MKYVSKFHIAVKPSIKSKWYLRWIAWLIWWKKISVVLVCKGDKEIIAKALKGRDVPVLGRVGKVITVEILFPWDRLLFGIVRYRGTIIEQANGMDIVKYGKARNF